MTKRNIHLSTCPRKPELFALAKGVLPEREAADLETHVFECAECLSAVDEFEQTSDSFIRALSTLPLNGDDEAAFGQLYIDLLARPEAIPATDRERGRLTNEQLPHVIGSYELLERIGQGATGSVYRARHVHLGKTVAVKVLDQDLLSEPAQQLQFEREMQAVGQLEHTNIIGATDAGQIDGRHLLVMEYYDGVDLSHLVRRIGPLTAANACAAASQAAEGLAFAHARGLVHCDIKPSNLLLTSDGTIKLLDLGLVAPHEDRPDDAHRAPRGTADYMAPEQWQLRRQVDGRADMYSLGCTLYKLLTGHPPFRLQGNYRAHRDVEREALVPTAFPGLPADGDEAQIDAVVRRMLHRDPQQRYQRMTDLVEALRPFAAGGDLQLVAKRVGLTPSAPARPGSVSEPISSQPRRASRRFMLGAGLAAASVGLVWGIRWWRLPPQLAIGSWRRLSPTLPVVLRSDDPRPQIDVEGAAAVRVATHGRTLVQFGRPVRGVFSVGTAATLDANVTSAGLFFRYRCRNEDGRVACTFQTIELVRVLGDSSTNYCIHWSHYSGIAGDEGWQFKQVVWGDTRPVPAVDGEQQLLVTLGLPGIPAVRWNGDPLQESSWTLSREAHFVANLPATERRRNFLGRLGVFQHGGETVFRHTRLKYLPS